MYILVFVYFFMLHVHQRTVQTAEYLERFTVEFQKLFLQITQCDVLTILSILKIFMY